MADLTVSAAIDTFLAGGVMAAPNGTGALPSITFASAPAYGFFITGGSTLGVGLAGGERMRFTTAALTVNNGTTFGFTSTSASSSAVDLGLARLGAANIRQGLAPSAAPIAQTLTIGEASRPGTDSGIKGANGTIQSGLGTGTATGVSSLIFQTPLVNATATAAQTYATGWTVIAGAGKASVYTVATLPPAATVGQGGIASVTDATQAVGTAPGTAPTGGGAVKRMVYCDGAAWLLI